ncbi:MAG: exodeoxyribonuclease III, partial [Bradyrhizobiaceae bacterium]|nr:exodeoxyribonuclease III [Bradyrhizobiaceae bacterium]
MRIASFNINNINRRLSNLLSWLRETEPDVVSLQELKATDVEFPVKAIREAGYEAVWRGQKSWNGVAILARWAPILTCSELPGDTADTQSRYIEAAVNGVLVASLYAPNGNPQPGPKFAYKLAWLKRLAAHATDLYATGAPVVLAGDYNVVPTAQDIYPTKSWEKDALLQPESRAAYAHILAQGWVDAIRMLHPNEPLYTFWDYKRQRWERDAGLRLDHILVSPSLVDRLRAASVDRNVRGEEGASDHAPVWIELQEASKARRVTEASADHATPTIDLNDRPLLVIDGDSFAHRFYHALPKTIRRADGKGAGSIIGFANFLLRLYQTERPRAVIVGWDTLEVPTERHRKFPAYQSGREFEDALLDQLKVLPDFVAACGFANAKAPGYEADDFLAAAVAAEERRGGTALVASGDRDTFQLASETTIILYPLRGGKIARIGPAEVRERYGVDPKQVPDFIALRGDPSDGLPGARGVGPKGAADLLGRYGTLQGILAAGRFPGEAEMLRLYRSIATMNAAAPLPSLGSQTPTWARASALAR